MANVTTITQHTLKVLQNGASWPAGHCPVCGHRGIRVTAQVMKAILHRRDHAHAREGFRFCPTPHCPIAYHDNEHGVFIHRSELNKALTLKDPGRGVPVCYCLRVTRGTILDAVAEGRVNSSEDAKRVTGACTGKACHIVNPAGACCGDQLRDTVALGLELAGAGKDAVEAALREDPGSTCCGRTLGRILAGEAEACASGGDCCA